ncbi:FRG1-like family-domain-containing protein [Globomyces pollinis-pini]|nr:FRG1-like family-domain-containing protein [Globomyces pollinis-pini]
MERVKTGKLLFKVNKIRGDKVPLVKKKSKKKSKELNQSKKQKDGWMAVDIPSEIHGPTIIMNHTFNLLNSVQSTNKISFKSVPHEFEPDTLNADTDPWVGSQVWISHPLGQDKYSFKSCFDKYLTCDKFGVVTCEMEAVGQTETWKVEKLETGFAIKSYFDKYLSVQDGLIRCDSDIPGLNETFHLRMQYSFKVQKKEKISSVQQEFEALKQFHSFGKKEIMALNYDVEGLTVAKRDGKLNEVLLNRRAVMKSDKFCK